MRCRRPWRAAVLVALATASGAARTAEPVAAEAETAVVLGVTINDSGDDLSAFFLRRPDGLWARGEDLDAWRILRPAAPPVEVDGHAYVPLSALKGLEARIDEATQSVRLTVPIDMFTPQTFSGNAANVPKLSPTIPSAFLNYDIAAETSSNATSARGFFEAGASNRLGLAATTFTVGRTFGGTAVTRLDSYLLRDNPASATRLVIGDAITASSAWSRPIRFGGVKFGTDFGLRPGYITFPTADFQGRTVLPSSVEFYADGALRYRRDVDRGPFAVDQAPLPAGAGQLTVVTRDVLGIERRTTTPYYVSTNLLRAGLTRYSIEVGAERNDFGRDSLDYSRPFVAGLYRHGLSNRLTVESRAEIGSKVQSGGVSLSSALPRLGEFGATAAMSSGGGGWGVLYGAYYSRTSQVWDLGLSIQQTNRAFTQLGIRERSEQIRRQIQGNAGRTLGRYGRIGISIADLKTADHNETKVASLSYSLNIGTLGYIDAFAVLADSSSGPTNSGAGVGLTIPLGPRATARVGGEMQNGKPSLTADYRVAPPTDRGLGYGGSVRLGAFGQQRADATWVGDRGEVRIDAARIDGVVGVRGTARGGLALAEGALFATRQLDGAFGIVDAGGYAGVRVYQDNRPLTRTNSRGLAIIPALRPYEDNAIRLAPDDMPIGARVDADDVILTPAYRSGVTAHFLVKTGHPATVLFDGPDGTPVSPGTAIIVDGGRERTFAGYDGEVFISDARPTMVLEAEIAGGLCKAIVTRPAGAVDLPQLGPVRCAQGEVK